MLAKNSFFTVVVRPIPRGITKDDLVSYHLSRFGQVKSVRFGDTKGVSGDVMYVDYFDVVSANAAVQGLNGVRDPGTSSLRMTAILSKASADAAMRNDALEPPAIQNGVEADHIRIQVRANVKFLKAKGDGEGLCVLDLDSIDY